MHWRRWTDGQDVAVNNGIRLSFRKAEREALHHEQRLNERIGLQSNVHKSWLTHLKQPGENNLGLGHRKVLADTCQQFAVEEN